MCFGRFLPNLKRWTKFHRLILFENKNLDEFLVKIEKEAGQMVFMAMSVPDYELMAYNLQEIKRFVKETKEVIVYYRTVMSDDEENIEEKSDNGKGNN